MPFIICEKSKQKQKVSIEVCFHLHCLHLKIPQNPESPWYCGFKSKTQKSIEKRKNGKRRQYEQA